MRETIKVGSGENEREIPWADYLAELDARYRSKTKLGRFFDRVLWNPIAWFADVVFEPLILLAGIAAIVAATLYLVSTSGGFFFLVGGVAIAFWVFYWRGS